MHPYRLSRFVRTLVLLLAGAALTACHYHGHHGHYSYGFHCAPVRYCR